MLTVTFNHVEETDGSLRRDRNGRVEPERGELSTIHKRVAWREDARHLAGCIHQEDAIKGLPLVGCSDERQLTGMAHGWPSTEACIDAAARRRLAPRRDRPPVGPAGNEDAALRPIPVDKGAQGDAPVVAE